jgi:uncharacterized protein YyaL (SSP411 family)
MNERLANSKSAYLRESVEQPVQWYTWSEEAFKKAKEEDKPILIDVGASWCHWCHVMDSETYSNNEIASIINQYFVPIKVDRDEMPDVDRKLQLAVSALVGESGWPLTVFMTPDGKVFFGGTYFPPYDKFGRPGFKRILLEIVRLWREERNKLINIAEQLIQLLNSREKNQNEFNENFINDCISNILSEYDIEYGGINSGMKFPHPTIDEILLSAHFWNNDDVPGKTVKFTLRQMYYGGIFDQVGGGFHRYTIDREWWIPHFEKLLIDNAELVLDYLNAFNLFKDLEFLDALQLTVDFIIRDMKVEGGFANSIDADSEGVEGKYYTWTKNEIREAVGNDYEIVERIFGLNKQGGVVENRKVLKRFIGLKDLSKILNKSAEDTIKWLSDIRKKLYEYRVKNRKMPFRDENKYTYPNCRTAEALLSSYIILNKGLNEGLEVVNKLSKTVTRRLEGGREGLLEDYATATLALIKAYEVTGEMNYYELAMELGKKILEFKTNDGFSDSINDKNLITINDMPNESPNSLAIRALLKLSVLNPYEFKIDEKDIKGLLTLINPLRSSFYSGILFNLFSILKGIAHIVIIDEKDGEAQKLHNEIMKIYYPFKITEKVTEENKEHLNPIIKNMLNYGREKGSRVYICIGNKCSMPVTDLEKIRILLKNSV